MLAQAYAWALRRAFKFLLKRALGRFLRDDLDAEQLDVALGSGVFEIRDAALDYYDKYWSEYWERLHEKHGLKK